MKLIREEGIVMKVKVRWTKGDGGSTGIKETVKRNPRNHCVIDTDPNANVTEDERLVFKRQSSK